MLQLELTEAQAESLEAALLNYLDSTAFNELEELAKVILDGDLTYILNQLEEMEDNGE